MITMGTARLVRQLSYRYNLERVPGNYDPFVREIYLEQFDEATLAAFAEYSRSGYSFDAHMLALLKYDRPRTVEQQYIMAMRQSPVIHHAIARVKATLRPALEGLRTLTADHLHQVKFKGGSAAGHTYRGKKRDNVEEALRRAKSTINTYPGVVKHGQTFRFTAAKAFARNHLSTIDNPKVRHVWGFPFHITLIEGLIAQPIIEALIKADTPIYIGRNIYKSMPADIAGLETIEGQTFYGFDFSSFDSSVNNWIIGEMFNILEELIIIEEPVAFAIIKDFFMNTPLLMPNGQLYIVETGIPSGSMFTQLIDSMVNLTLIYAFAEHFQLRDLSLVRVLGDDSAFRSSTLVGPNDSAEFFGQFGMNLNLEKSIISRNPEDVYFLGHHFLGTRVTREEFTLLSLALYPEDPVTSASESLLRVAGLLIDSGMHSMYMLSLMELLETKYGINRRDLGVLNVSEMFRVLD